MSIQPGPRCPLCGKPVAPPAYLQTCAGGMLLELRLTMTTTTAPGGVPQLVEYCPGHAPQAIAPRWPGLAKETCAGTAQPSAPREPVPPAFYKAFADEGDEREEGEEWS